MAKYFLKSNYIKMISETSSTNPESFTLIGDTSCKRGRNPVEIPTI